jgi:hypothetical protein
MEYLVGVDIGGTGTACVVIDEKGGLTTGKAFSTPPNFTEGVVNAVKVAGSGKESFVQCTWCGEKLCPADANWKENVVARKISVAESGPWRRDSGLFFMWEFFAQAVPLSLMSMWSIMIIYRYMTKFIGGLSRPKLGNDRKNI